MGFYDYSDWRPEPMPEPCFIVPNGLRDNLLGELQRELSEGHLLFGEESVAAVAKCGGCDDVVFSIDGERFIRWARVHLTWSGRPETPPLPRTHEFQNFRSSMTDHDH